MIGSRWKKLLTLFGTILALNLIFFTFASAKDLNMVMKKGDIHPKLSSSLWELEKEYEKGAMAAQAYAQSRNLRTEYPDMISVYLISEPGTIIDEGSLQAYGAEIIKSAGNVWKVRAPINMIETIADNIKGISFIKLPDRGIPVTSESEGVGLTGASSYHSAGYTGAGVKIAVIDTGFAGLSSAISAGELPNTVVMIDCTGSSCIPTGFSSETDFHGTAVAEIVHDMASESALYLIKMDDTLDLKDAKDYAIANGIKIINHSVLHPNTNFYSGWCYNSNSVCTANDAYINGILWVNAMGNWAEKHYGATFTDSDGDSFHDVAPGDDETINIDASAGEIIDVRLTWEA
jgi:subtilisin family serine protease